MTLDREGRRHRGRVLCVNCELWIIHQQNSLQFAELGTKATTTYFCPNFSRWLTGSMTVQKYWYTLISIMQHIMQLWRCADYALIVKNGAKISGKIVIGDHNLIWHSYVKNTCHELRVCTALFPCDQGWKPLSISCYCINIYTSPWVQTYYLSFSMVQF